ncbi:MAG: glutaredoxin domain-containing protein [Candidatus Binataceae bacterium]|jgi:glutaredoxin-like protein NrdH
MAARDIIVYSSPLCAPCERMKEYLRSRGVAFKVVDVMIDEAAGELLESKNIRSTPVLSVDGEMVVGFQREAIDKILGLG